jgi:hypothetical protein
MCTGAWNGQANARRSLRVSTVFRAEDIPIRNGIVPSHRERPHAFKLSQTVSDFMGRGMTFDFRLETLYRHDWQLFLGKAFVDTSMELLKSQSLQ